MSTTCIGGRRHKQTTDGQEYTTGYTYNLSGALVEQTYPSGRVVKNTFDADGALSQVQSKRSSETYRNFANGFVYNAAGAVTAMKLGNGRWENTTFNSRLQPTQIGLGAGAYSQSLLKLEYSYGTTANNGNVVEQKITVPGVTHPFVQAYTYDELNRLKSATETQNSTQTWKQTFTFDRYGNRNFDEANTTTLVKNCGSSPNFTVCAADKKIVNPSVNTANNRLSTSDDYAFDSSGNTTGDAEGRTFVYDAENKQILVSDGNGTIGEYSYDGDGRRIKKYVPSTGEVTVFVYDAASKLIGEYSTVVQPVQDAKTVYTTNDHLGSPRINTDAAGQVISRHDYHPFGEEIARTGYGYDTIRKQFTGYERDKETDLDFAQARMYANRLGRFSTTDPSARSIDRMAPQTWNRYTYCYNNPLTLIDENGKWPTGTHNNVLRKALDGMNKDARRLMDAVTTSARKVDRDGVDVKTMKEENAPQHAMTPKSYLSSKCDLGCAKEKARGAAKEFIATNLQLAKSEYDKVKDLADGDAKFEGVKKSLEYFGAAMHTVTDNRSPAHSDFQVFDGNETTKIIVGGVIGGIPGALAGGRGTIQHMAIEKRAPNATEENLMVDEIRLAFQSVYGSSAYEQSVSEEERRRTQQRQSQGRQGGMLIP
ncbi:MAG: RHS repeat domain-containing protein [Pyrinomonadaceae bacterium]